MAILHSQDFNSFTAFMDACISDSVSWDYSFEYFRSITPAGMVLEFGVAHGSTITQIANVFPDRTIHGFDSFEGLPENWRIGFPAGTFKCDMPHVPESVALHKGLFNETLPSFLSQYTDKIAFVHMDADLYSSTSYVLENIEDRFIDGSIIIFDELHYFDNNYKDHEYKAFDEFISRTGFKVTFLKKRTIESYCFKLTR